MTAIFRRCPSCGHLWRALVCKRCRVATEATPGPGPAKVKEPPK